MVEKRTVVITYVADDGTEFKDKVKCLEHDNYLSLKKQLGTVWLVYGKRGNDRIEVFSTEELAVKSLQHAEDKQRYVIEEMVVDFRFHRELLKDTK